jgi:hypothetical protein
MKSSIFSDVTPYNPETELFEPPLRELRIPKSYSIQFNSIQFMFINVQT